MPGLPLAGPDNVIGVNQVCAWQTGGPLRTSFASGGPDHDPVRWNTEALLDGGGVDCLLWLGSLHERPCRRRRPDDRTARRRACRRRGRSR